MTGYRSQSDDVSEAVDRQWFELLRDVSPVERLRMAVRACQALEKVQIAGIRLRHPEASEEELRRRAGALRLGRELTLWAYGPEAEAWFD